MNSVLKKKLYLPGVIIRVFFFEFVDITQVMHPTALMKALIDVVSCVEVAAKHALEIFPNKLFDNFSRMGVMVLVIPHSWGTHAPDISIQAIFSPASLICLNGGTGLDLRFERLQPWLEVRNEAMLQFDDLPTAYKEAMNGLQVHLDLSDGQAHQGP